MNFFDFGLILALTICTIGVVRRLSGWGGIRIDQSDKPLPESRRNRLVGLVRAILLDVLALARTARTSPFRWVAHCLVFFGFMGLLLFHALDDQFTVLFFPAYESTLDPWQWLRNLFGLMALVGLSMMMYRRFANRKLNSLSRFQDWAAIVVVFGIILSGFFLEAAKIISPAVFDRMVVEYFVPEDGSDITALKSYWAHKYGVVFSEQLPMSEDILEHGASLDEDSCVDCHSDTSSAFISRPLATALGPVAPALNISRADEVFWYLHILFCFVGLAALPFGKFLHPLSTPLNLASRLGRRDSQPVAEKAVKGLGFDACTRCGECSLHCSVASSHVVLGNTDILPSEKLISLKRYWTEKGLEGEGLASFAEGSRICTECLRCTDICPSGINLQDLWMSSKTQVAQDAPDPNKAIRKMDSKQWIEAYGHGTEVPVVSGLADKADSYWACVQCTTCTSVCPVVAVSEDPTRDLDLTPQQIMNLLRMGLKDQTLGARMVWSCTTCYKCQENCPQNIRVADVLYELRNTVATRKRGGTDHEEES